ncbi:MAG: hypothetical protein GY839_02100 [candidate division Zixibacteria bacterium]|nr:hypothetical protein [candidate division Zixibacteria bacterium]
MNYELKKIDLFSAIKISFLVNAIIGLLVGLLIGLIMMVIMGVAGSVMPYDQMDYGGPDIGAMGMFGGFFIGILYALLIAVGNGIILTGIVVLLYNLFAGWLGGIKLKFDKIPDETVSQTAVSQSTMDNTGGDSTNA